MEEIKKDDFTHVLNLVQEDGDKCSEELRSIREKGFIKLQIFTGKTWVTIAEVKEEGLGYHCFGIRSDASGFYTEWGKQRVKHMFLESSE